MAFLGFSYFIAKFDPAGNTIWANSINEHWLGFDYNQMDIDISGNVYLGAQITDTVHFGDDFTYVPVGKYDLFVAKYLNDGELDWVKTMESGTHNAGSVVWLFTMKKVYMLVVVLMQYLNFGSTTLTSLNKHGFVALIGETVGINVYEKDRQY